VAVGRVVGFIPAQLKTWLMWECWEMIWEMKASQSVSEPMLKVAVKGVLLVSWVISVVVVVRRESLMSQRQRVAPREASFRAVALPIPEAALAGGLVVCDFG